MSSTETEQDRNKAASRRFHDEVWTKGNLDVIDELFEPDYKVQNLPPWRKPGAAGLKEFIADNHRMFADIVSVVDDQVAEGDKVATKFHATATHVGDLNGPVGLVKATGKQVTWKGMTIARYRDGKVVESAGLFDNMDLMQQLGAVPRPSTP
jgi:predicted ester cyclase